MVKSKKSEIENNKEYEIRGKSFYFLEKYGTSNPKILIEGLCEKVFGCSWMFANGNPTALQYAMRAGFIGLPTDNNVYYGKINGIGELVHISELILK